MLIFMKTIYISLGVQYFEAIFSLNVAQRVFDKDIIIVYITSLTKNYDSRNLK